MTYNKIFKTILSITSLSFINNLGFIDFSSSIKNVVKAVKKVAQTVIEWEIANAVSYDTTKTRGYTFF